MIEDYERVKAFKRDCAEMMQDMIVVLAACTGQTYEQAQASVGKVYESVIVPTFNEVDMSTGMAIALAIVMGGIDTTEQVAAEVAAVTGET